MKVAGTKENFRVVIEPRSLGDFGSVRMSDSMLYGRGDAERKRRERDIEDRCDEIAAEVKRHVNNVRSVCVEFDQEMVCEHCGSTWTEDNPEYNGGCCDKDEAANAAAREQPA